MNFRLNNLPGITAFAVCVLVYCCTQKQVYQATRYDFPKKVNTEDHPVSFQEKGIFSDPDQEVFVRNDFPAARLNGFRQVKDSLYEVTITPENSPINPSPWYAFKIWSTGPETIALRLHYPKSRHRYFPKLSADGTSWQDLDSAAMSYPDSADAVLTLSISADTLWVAAQEIIDSRAVYDWCQTLADDQLVHFDTIGKSKLGRPLYFLDIYGGSKKNKETIVILSRQHPPEVTGYMAMQAFLKELLGSGMRQEFFKKYRVMVYPLLNPDGVDLGHWRHNAGGIDLNRDWEFYHQPETRAVADHIVHEVKTNNDDVIIGLDFHSTYNDVYYTMTETTSIPHFREPWFARIEELLGNGYRINESAASVGAPVTKGWFFTQFAGAEGITYEIGDNTSREFIARKGRVSAQALMEVLLNGMYR